LSSKGGTRQLSNRELSALGWPLEIVIAGAVANNAPTGVVLVGGGCTGWPPLRKKLPACGRCRTFLQQNPPCLPGQFQESVRSNTRLAGLGPRRAAKLFPAVIFSAAVYRLELSSGCGV
jgi:hypothetical protein